MIELYKGDCLELIKNVEDNSIDCILTDPPYGINYQCMYKTKSKRSDKILNDDRPFIDFIKDLPRVLKPTGCLFLFTRWDKQQVFIEELNRNGLKVRSIIIWDKVYHTMGDLKRAFGRKYESILFVSGDKFRFPAKRPKDIIQVKHIAPNKLIHPNQKPVELLEKLLIMTTVENDTVLDLFMGSGSTGIACINTGRNFIGIEMDEKYFNIAKDRIESNLK